MSQIYPSSALHGLRAAFIAYQHAGLGDLVATALALERECARLGWNHQVNGAAKLWATEVLAANSKEGR